MARVLDKVVEDVASKAVNNLVQTVADNIKLVRTIDSSILDLTSDIETFSARLVDVSKNPSAKELQVLRVVVKKFQSIVNEAQDAVAKYISLQKKHEDNVLAKCFDKLPVPVCGNVNVCANEIQSIMTKMNKLIQTHEKDLISFMNNYLSKGQDYDQQPLQRVVEEGNPTGFEDQVETITARITGSSNNFIVIPIVGMPGTGKTTFASQILNHINKLNMFAHTIWVHVSQSLDSKQMYIDILYQITKRAGDSNITEYQLMDRIKDLLKDKKYFIVLDDMG